MKKLKLVVALFISIIFLISIAGCSKIQLGSPSGGNSWGCGGYCNFINFRVKVVKLRTYPVTSHLLIERHVHPTYDSSVIYQNTLLSVDLPLNDTTLFCIDTMYYNHYLTWKVTGINGDSLSSGRTPLLHISQSVDPIQVLY